METLKRGSKTLLGVTNINDRRKASKQIRKLATKHDLYVASMPLLIQALTNDVVRETLRPAKDLHPGNWLDTTSGEYFGVRDGKPFYEVWHGVGSLAEGYGAGILSYCSSMPFFEPLHVYSMPSSTEIAQTRGILGTRTPNEWINAGLGMYKKQKVTRLPVEELRKGNKPSASEPYIVFMEGYPNENNDPENYLYHGDYSVRLDADSFMESDRALMICGSHENREQMARMFFGEKGGDGLEEVTLRGDIFYNPSFLDGRIQSQAACAELRISPRGEKCTGVMFNEKMALYGKAPSDYRKIDTTRFVAVNKDYMM